MGLFGLKEHLLYGGANEKAVWEREIGKLSYHDSNGWFKSGSKRPPGLYQVTKVDDPDRWGQCSVYGVLVLDMSEVFNCVGYRIAEMLNKPNECAYPPHRYHSPEARG